MREIQKVTTCQLARDPAGYNHKLVEVTAFVTQGFENFTLFDPTCKSWIWLESVKSTSPRNRPGPVVIEDISISFLDDPQFREFDRLIQRPPDRIVRATIVGRFFSGSLSEANNGWMYGGYGHFGCCSLLAIQRVLSVDAQRRTDLDYRSSADQPKIARVGCGYRELEREETDSRLIAAQQEAERGSHGWAFTDPQRVALEELAHLLKHDPVTITGMSQTRKSPGRILFEWKPAGFGKQYLLVASRPYWLSFHAKDPEKVAWVIIAAYESYCR